MGQEAGAADTAQEGPQQGLGGLVVVPAGRAGVSGWAGVGRLSSKLPTLLHLLAVFLAEEAAGGPPSTAGWHVRLFLAG